MYIRVYEGKVEMGEMAAAYCAGIINKTIQEKNSARIILATGASQFSFLESFVKMKIPWDKVTCFHLDEYAGLPSTHPASFRNYLQERVWSKVSPKMGQIHMMNPEKLDEYEALLLEDEVDLACIGIGENGHIAFNDPPVADFKDKKMVKIVELDEACRKQQVGEGWFDSIESTPARAATLTVPAIMRAKAISVVVPDERKSVAVKNALLGDISTKCPASILRTHNNTVLWLDKYSQFLYRSAAGKSFISSGEVPFPGLIDIQVNGYKGVSFSDMALTKHSFKQICHHILDSFALMFVPTVITSNLAVYEHVLPVMADVIESDEELKSRIPGIHLEGPFLSSKANGCHDVKYLLSPSIDLLDKWQRLGRGKIVLMTIAAELEGAEKFTQYAAALGIRVCLGHQMAGADDLNRLTSAGASLITHFGNGMPPKIPRHNSAIQAALLEDRLSVSLITDGRHIPDDFIRLAIKVKGLDRVMVVSDIAPVAGSEPGEYTMYERQVVIGKDGFLRMKDTGIMAGSAYNTLQCANYLIKSNLITSVEDIEKICFTNPLKLLGMNPEDVKGKFAHLLSIEDGFLIHKKRNAFATNQ